MHVCVAPTVPIASSSLQDYFHRSVSRAVDHQGVEAADATIHYLVNLLTHFSRSENLFDYTDEGLRLRPLAQIYADAVHSGSDLERRLMLRRMGDIALFVSGMFSGFFARRRALVGRDYYIAMGGSAYASLADGSEHGAGAGIGHGAVVGGEVFGQLSSGFRRFVLVLTEVGDEGARQRQHELRRLFESWAEGWVQGAGQRETHGGEPTAGRGVVGRSGRYGQH